MASTALSARFLLSSVACILGAVTFAGAPARAQGDILYYRFDEAGGMKAINYASSSGLAPAEGDIVSTSTQQWAPGRFGASSLRGADGPNDYNYLDSGWTGPLSGSFTVAWFMRERTPLPNTLAYYFFSGIGSFRAFTSGAASMGIRLGGFGGSDVNLTADVRTPAATRWVHVACVVDATAGTGTWYVDGLAQPSTPTGGANLSAGTVGFRVGTHTRLTTGTFWDMDEFRLVNRAATAAEVLRWSQGTSPAAGTYGAGCGARLTSAGGSPALGNPLFRAEIDGAATAPFLFALGADRLFLGPIPLPFDLGAALPGLRGCMWETSSHVMLAGATDASGRAVVPLPIPNDAALDGGVVYLQALLAAAAGEQTTGGLGVGLGR